MGYIATTGVILYWKPDQPFIIHRAHNVWFDEYNSRLSIEDKRLVPAQDVHFFYTRSHFSAFQNCALILSTNFQFIFTFKGCTTQFSH